MSTGDILNVISGFCTFWCFLKKPEKPDDDDGGGGEGRGGNGTLGFDGSISVISAHLTCPPSTAQEDKEDNEGFPECLLWARCFQMYNLR